MIEQKLASEIERLDASLFDYDAWFRDIETLRQQIRSTHGDNPPIDVVGILRDIRDGDDK